MNEMGTLWLFGEPLKDLKKVFFFKSKFALYNGNNKYESNKPLY